MRRLRLLTGGESHGPGLTVILEGLPAGLEIDRDEVNSRLRRRQHGFGRGGRQRIEKDEIQVRGGLRDGRTLGSPLVLAVDNLDWKNWSSVMDPWQVDPERAARLAVTRPRPGHADYSGGAATDQLGDMRSAGSCWRATEWPCARPCCGWARTKFWPGPPPGMIWRRFGTIRRW
jgi:chorismate synthase